MKYFAYGSNLDEDQMRARCPHATAGPRAVFQGHALVFTGHSRRWGGAVASVVRAAQSSVQGLVWELTPEDLATLDRFEGHPHAYQRVERVVVDEKGQQHQAWLYVVPEARLSLGPPSSEYLGVIRRAYRRLQFDEAPVERAARVE